MVTILGFVLLLCIFLLILGIIIYAGYKIYQMFKKRNDLMWKVRKERLNLCKSQSTYSSKHWYNIKKNTPIRLLKFHFLDGKSTPFITKPVAYHKGDFVSNEGNVIISMYIPGNRQFLIFPRPELLIINNVPERTLKVGKIEHTFKLPTAKEIVQFQRNPDEILISADGISDAGEVYVPVIRDMQGNPIDLAAFAIDSMQAVGIAHLFNEHLNLWSIANRKAVDTNPYVRILQKTQDQNTSVEQHNRGGQL